MASDLIFQKQTMSSIEIAELSGKQHKHVLEAIRSMEPAWEKVSGTKFRLAEYTDAQGKQRPCYELTKTECLYVATKFNDEARAKLVKRWEELEIKSSNGAFQIPQSFSEALQLAADQARKIEEQQKQIEEKNEKIAQDAPRVLFSKAVETAKRSCLVAELAKILQQNGINIGQNRLFAWMREHGYLCSKGQYYNQPTQKAMQLGLFEIKQTTINKPDGSVLVSTTTKVTGKGQIYFVNKFLNEKKEGRMAI